MLRTSIRRFFPFSGDYSGQLVIRVMRGHYKLRMNTEYGELDGGYSRIILTNCEQGHPYRFQDGVCVSVCVCVCLCVCVCVYV